MTKPFKTYRQQLSILRGRNLIITDGAKAISILKNEGYYNVINGYKDIFIDITLTKQHGTELYKAGTKFEYIHALYEFDRNMRSILLKYILMMEQSIKTKVSYHFSNQFKQEFNYLNINNFDNTDPREATKLLAKLSELIKYNSEPSDQGGQFYHYLDQHKELPLWVLVTRMTFGTIVSFYKTMQQKTKDAVAQEIVSTYERSYNTTINIPLVQQEKFISLMITFISHFRNICAHEERLYNYIVKNKKKKPLNISLFHKSTSLVFLSKIVDCIIILGLFLPKKDYKCLVKLIINEIDKLSTQLPQHTFKEILIKMGFSKNWKQDITLP